MQASNVSRMFYAEARFLRRFSVAQSHRGTEGGLFWQTSATQNVATHSKVAAASISLRQPDVKATQPLVRDDVSLEVIFEDDWLLVSNGAANRGRLPVIIVL